MEIGHDGRGFSYDNEGPRHRALVPAFSLATRPVTNGEYLEFIEAGGYKRPEYWLSLGWTTVNDPPQAGGKRRFTGRNGTALVEFYSLRDATGR